MHEITSQHNKECSFSQFKKQMTEIYGEEAVTLGIKSCTAKNWTRLKGVFLKTPEGILVKEVAENLEIAIQAAQKTIQAAAAQLEANSTSSNIKQNRNSSSRVAQETRAPKARQFCNSDTICRLTSIAAAAAVATAIYFSQFNE